MDKKTIFTFKLENGINREEHDVYEGIGFKPIYYYLNNFKDNWSACNIYCEGKLLFVEWSDSYGGLGPKPDDIVRDDVAKTLFESHGFTHEKDILTGDHHYGFVVQKT